MCFTATVATKHRNKRSNKLVLSHRCCSLAFGQLSMRAVQTACSVMLLAHPWCTLVVCRQAAAQPSMAVVGDLRPIILSQCEQDFIQSLVWVLKHCAAMLQ